MKKAALTTLGVFLAAVVCIGMLFATNVVDAAYVTPDPAQRDGFNVNTSDGSLVVLRAGTKVLTISSSGDLTITDDLTVTDDLAVTGLATIGETLAVTGNSTLTGTLDVNGASTALGLATTFMRTATTQTAAYTVTCDTGAEDAGGIIFDLTDNAVITLPAVAAANLGCCVTLINTAADDAAKVAFSPQPADAVYGTVAAFSANGTDAHAISNTKSGANKGDYLNICSDGSTGWFIVGGVGVWGNEIL